MGPLYGPALHELYTPTGKCIPQQFGWDNVGFWQAKCRTTFRYADSGYAACVETNKVLAMGYHPEAALPDSKLMADAIRSSAHCTRPFWWAETERQQALAYNQEQLIAFLNK